ncbi:5942_t:CDS:2, partial [Funneliformis geosporum]
LRKYLNSLARNQASLPCIIWISYRKILSNESQGKINDFKLSGLRICNYQDKQNLFIDKWDIIIVQVESLSRIEFLSHSIVAILDEINAINHQMSSAYRDKNIRVIDNKFQPLVVKTVEYLYDPNSRAEAMRIEYELLHRASVTIEAGISFEKTDHFDAVIGITNIVTPVNVKAFIQMMFRIRDCKKRILFLYYQKNSNKLFRPAGYKNICAELESARPNDLPTAIRGHYENRGVIGNRKRIRNEVRIKALIIKETDFDAVATFRNLDPEEAENLKFDQEHSIPDTMTLKRFYMRNIYDANENIEKSVAEDLHKSYSANHWKAIRELFQILGFTGIDDKRILSGNMVSETFTQSCEKFIEIR